MCHGAYQARAYPRFWNMKQLGIFLLPLNGMLVHHRVTPNIKFAVTHLHQAGEKHGEINLSCPTTQQNVSGQYSKPDHLIQSQAH